MALYQRIVDPTWLPMGRDQSIYYLKKSSGPFGNPNNFAAWLAVVLPLAIGWGARRKYMDGQWRWFPWAVALAAILGIGLSLSRGIGLALFVGGLVWLLTRHTLPLARRCFLAIGILGLSTLGVWSAYHISPEVRQRVDTFVAHGGERTRPHMWHIATKLWQEEPWIGKGGGSFGALLEKHRPEGLWETPEHAHNDYLDTLLEYGVIGMVFGFGGALGGFVWGVRRRMGGAKQTPEARAIPWSLAIFGAGILIDFHLQSPAILTLVGLLSGVWLSGGPSLEVRGSQFFTFIKPPVRIGFGVVLAGFLITFSWIWAKPVYASADHRYWARELIDDIPKGAEPSDLRGHAAQAELGLQKAVALNPADDRAWADLSYAISLQGFKSPLKNRELGERAEVAARRALAGSEEVAEYWIRLGVSLDLQGRWGEAGLAFGRAVGLAPRQPVVWYYQGFHLSLKPMMHEMAKATLATCLRLDPWYHEAKLLKASLEWSP